MTWVKLDDNWTRKIRALRLTLPARWHYLEMIEFVCASEAYDEPMAASDARTCSDMDDPLACLAELEEKGLVTRDMNGDYLVTRIDDHTLPPHLRESKRKPDQAIRQRRSRAHKAGDHSLCLQGRCPDAPVTREVTRDTGSGRAGTRRTTPVTESKIPQQPSPPPPPCGVDLRTGEVKPCVVCEDPTGDCACFDDPSPVPVGRVPYDPSMEPPGWD